jgi:hypothetical protein
MARVSCHYSASPQGQLLYPRFLLIAGNHTTLQEMRSELLPDFKDQIGCRLGRQTLNSTTGFPQQSNSLLIPPSGPRLSTFDFFTWGEVRVVELWC